MEWTFLCQRSDLSALEIFSWTLLALLGEVPWGIFGKPLN